MISQNRAIPAQRAKGIILVITAAILWGVSGTVAQYLFEVQGFSVDWLVVTRLLIAGVILLVFAYKKEGSHIWNIWKGRQDRVNLLLLSILGMLAVQYTYFAAIKHGNAATATILQYLAPVLITCYIAIRVKKVPSFKELIAVLLAVFGTFLLVTQGRLEGLTISKWALIWGISSAVALAYYTLQPLTLLAKWGSTLVIGWAMLIGGTSFSFIHPPWIFQGDWSISALLAVIFVVLFGTVIPFYCYLESLHYLSASETSVLACVEPLSAALLAVVWLNVSFGIMEWMGTLCIVTTIMILALSKRQPATSDTEGMVVERKEAV
ncbi:DMT family transporter [Ammoniphilus sp. YIM 78166]|uniref:EamA family transporter n=1 Tax=Ammoniphilus sp. YIM 78166 TaxID=1644106 RepID=UPI00196A8D25|nr:DMT family transporter [Ammoniphilus sp. YIM 78166]